jgi:hypothetical protein
MNHRKKLYISIAVLSAWLVFAVGVAVGAFAVGPALVSAATPSAGADTESQYHRGLYDICRTVLQGEPQECMQAVASARERHWYEQESPGWTWPPSESSTP